MQAREFLLVRFGLPTSLVFGDQDMKKKETTDLGGGYN